MPDPTIRRVSCLAALALLAAALAGCLPSRVVLDLAPGDGELEEVVVLSEPPESSPADRVAIIPIEGLIALTGQPGLIQSRGNVVDAVSRRLARVEEDDRVRAVVLRINSPGGTVAASEALHAEIEAFRSRTGRPVVVSMAEVAASGGYYVATAADHVVAQPSSVTGSIGVVILTFDVSRGLDMIGVEGRAITSGPNKALASPFEPRRSEHDAILQEMTDDFYGRFRDLVVASRPDLPPDRLDEITDGRVFTGAQAFDLGLVDELGGVREAFATARRLAGIEQASLVAYVPEGLAPATPYAAMAEASRGLGGDVTVQLLPESALPLAPGVFYHVWRP